MNARADFERAARWADIADTWQDLALTSRKICVVGYSDAHVAAKHEFSCNVARNHESRALRGEL